MNRHSRTNLQPNEIDSLRRLIALYNEQIATNQRDGAPRQQRRMILKQIATLRRRLLALVWTRVAQKGTKEVRA
jgi:hypothetical protein